MATPRPNGSAEGFRPAFYRMKDVMRITSLSRLTLYRRIAAERFPAPVKLGSWASGYAAESTADDSAP